MIRRLKHLLLLAVLSTCPQWLYAQTFTLPAQTASLPAWWGCSASGSVVTCNNYSEWTNSRNIAVSSPVTLRLNGGAFNGADINVGGSAANLTVQMINNSSLSIGNNSRVVANVSAANVYATGNNVVLSGNYVVQGQINIGGNNAQFSGAVTAGAIEIGSNAQLTGNLNASNNLTLGQGSTANGNLSGGTVNINNNATANGNLTATGNVNLSQGSTVNGAISAGGSLNANNTGVDIQGNVTVNGDANLGPGIQVIGSVDANGNINMNSNGYIDGNVSGNNVNIGSSSVIDGSVESAGQVSNQGTINGNVNSDGPVYTQDGVVTGYVNAPNEEQVGNTGNVGGPVCDQNANEGPCSGGGSGVQFYRIEHSGSALTCEATTVVVRACADAGCAGGVDLTGAVTVRASGISDYTAAGNFAGSPVASVALPITSAGSFTLSLDNVPAVAAGPVQCTGGCAIEAVDAAFFFQPVSTQTAGSSFSVQIDAIRTDSNTGACVAAVQGLTEIDMALTCLDPDSCSNDGALLSVAGEAASEFPVYTPVPVTFDNTGSAVLAVNYHDAGRIRLLAQADIGPLVLAGESQPFVVRPATIGIEISNAVSYTPGVFARAGDDLHVTLSALTSGGDITPNFGKEAVPAVLTLSSLGNAVMPVAGVDGDVQILQPFSVLQDGVFRSQQVRYMEAGSAVFTAHTQTLDYLGTGNLTAQSAVIGRFLPWQFHIESAWVLPACNIVTDVFSYLDQAFSATVNVSARNRDQQLTLNYPDTGTPAALTLQARDEVADQVLTARLTPMSHSISWVQGQGVVNANNIALSKLADYEPDGPFEQVSLAASITDGLPGGPYVPTANADFNDAVIDCTTECNAVVLEDNLQFLFGEMVLTDTYGPETGSVDVTLMAHFWDGERFRLNTADACTATDPDLLQIVLNPASLVTTAAGYPEQLSAGRALPGSLVWTAPGQQGFIRFIYQAPDWLKSDTADDGNPAAIAEFGQFGGHDRVIHWRQVR